MGNDTTATVAETKPWYLSKGVIGALVAAAAIVAGFFGVKIDPTTQQVVADQATAVIAAGVALGGAVLALYGRLKATKLIG
ncbi:hypothetical protein [Methylobacterium sp. J-070]|uniref:hypothetical protein n=1 Tax=Methylobacterium sp. J-070 TaxID=2836650 RepID=UPI001FB9CFC1|nr:hypothetical protein [Methylobacterium sp. J-070]MCJ2050883.1 hypothetical protein [Methylobacterium sp. J-070]